MMEILVTLEMKEFADERFQEVGRIKKYNYSATDNSAIGAYCAEFASLQILGPDAEYVGHKSKEHDIILHKNKIDVKSRESGLKPKENFLIRIYNHQRHFDVDFYLWFAVAKNLEKLWLLGAIPKKTFWSLAKEYKAGEKYADNATWSFDEDCHCMEIKQLKPIKIQNQRSAHDTQRVSKVF